MANYREMQDRILREIIRPEGYRVRIKEAIQSAVEHYTGENFWFNEQQAFRDTQSGKEFYELPDGSEESAPAYAQTGTLRITLGQDDEQMLLPRSNDWIEERFTTKLSQPTDFALVDERYRLYPIPDGVYRITLFYTKVQPPLIEDTDENDWTNVGERLVRTRAKAYIYTNTIRDVQQAQLMAELVKDEFDQLKKRHVNYVFPVTRVAPWL